MIITDDTIFQNYFHYTHCTKIVNYLHWGRKIDGFIFEKCTIKEPGDTPFKRGDTIAKIIVEKISSEGAEKIALAENFGCDRIYNCYFGCNSFYIFVNVQMKRDLILMAPLRYFSAGQFYEYLHSWGGYDNLNIMEFFAPKWIAVNDNVRIEMICNLIKNVQLHDENSCNTGYCSICMYCSFKDCPRRHPFHYCANGCPMCEPCTKNVHLRKFLRQGGRVKICACGEAVYRSKMATECKKCHFFKLQKFFGDMPIY